MCSYIRHFNVLMLILEDKKRAESMLKDNATTISEADNMLFQPRYEELVAKSLGSKNRLEELFGSIKIKDHPRMDHPLFRSRKNRGKESLQLLVKLYNSNTLQKDRQKVRINLLIAPSINSRKPSEFCKIHPRVVHLFPVNFKEILLQGGKMCKIDLKEAYFAISLSTKSRNYVRFQWKTLPCEFLIFASDCLQLLWPLESY